MEVEASQLTGRGAWLLLPFVIVGGALTLWSGSWWVRLYSMGSWDRVPATVERVEWIHERSATRSRSRSWIECTYRYSVDGNEFVGTRVYPGRDPGVSAHCTWLERHQASGEPVMARVDPARPSRAVLIAWIDAAMVLAPAIGLTFLAMGGSALLDVWLASRATVPITTARGPAVEVRLSRRVAIAVSTWLTVLFGLPLLGLFGVLGSEAGGMPPALPIMLCALPTLGAVLFLLWFASGRLRFGAARLRVFGAPIAVGDELVAQLRVPRGIEAGQRVRFKIERRLWREQRSWPKSRRWTVDAEVEIDGDRGAVVPLRWPVPADADDVRAGRVDWGLHAVVRGRLGARFSRFELPIREPRGR